MTDPKAIPPVIIATLLWDANAASQPYSRSYDETWVEKLYRGFARNLTVPFRFVVFTDREREFAHPEIEQDRIGMKSPDYGACLEPYRLNQPMILVGLDTIVTGNCDSLALYCMTARKLAVPRDPFNTHTVCNGVALVPAGHEHVWLEGAGKNDMEWIREQDAAVIDDLFPGLVVSYKGHVKEHGLGDARIVYFHGFQKMGEIDADWIEAHWR